VPRWLMKCEVESNLGVQDGQEPLSFTHASGNSEVRLENLKMDPGEERPLLTAYFFFDESDIEVADANGLPRLRRFFEFLSFLTGSRFRVTRRICLMDWSPGILERRAITYQRFGVPELPQRILAPRIAESVSPLLAAETNPDVMQALHWFSAGLAEEQPDGQFEMFWFCIETLARIPGDGERVPDRCAVCRSPLYCPQCRQETTHRPYPSQRIQRIFTEVAPDNADALFGVCSDMRHALMHGDRVERVFEKHAITLEDLVDKVGRIAWTAMLNALIRVLPPGTKLSLSFLQPNTFVNRHMAGKAYLGMANPTGRDAQLTDLPTGVEMKMIVSRKKPTAPPSE
jgi:hypothetical protein